MTEEEKSALGFVEMVGPVLQAIGSAADSEEIHEVGNLLSKIPVEQIAGIFARWRLDIVNMDTGTMVVGEGVEVVKDDDA